MANGHKLQEHVFTREPYNSTCYRKLTQYSFETVRKNLGPLNKLSTANSKVGVLHKKTGFRTEPFRKIENVRALWLRAGYPTCTLFYRSYAHYEYRALELPAQFSMLTTVRDSCQ